MPIFEYHCDECATDFEVLQRTRDTNELPKCPSCGAQNAKKRFSAFATAGTQKKTTGDNGT